MFFPVAETTQSRRFDVARLATGIDETFHECSVAVRHKHDPGQVQLAQVAATGVVRVAAQNAIEPFSPGAFRNALHIKRVSAGMQPPFGCKKREAR